MKKTLFILGGIGMVCLFLIIRLFVVQHNRMTEERNWFAEALRYEFSAVLDSVEVFNNHTGRLRARIIEGDPEVHREDSLKQSFKEHDMLYLIFQRSGDSIIFLIPQGNLVAKGDSVRVSSQQNSIQFFREGKPVHSGELSETLTGFGRPFFLKKQ